MEAIQYPCEVRNYNRESRLVADREEHIGFALEPERGSLLARLMVSGLDPSQAVSADSWQWLEWWIVQKRYGMQFLFPGGIETCPAATLWAMDSISSYVEKHEKEQMEKAHQGN